MLKNSVAIIGAAAILALCNFSGLISSYQITHNFWHQNAVLYGGGAGVLLAVIIFWLSARSAKMSRLLVTLVNLVFVISLIAVWVFSRRFINAEQYDAMAVQFWHKSSYAVIISFIPQTANLLRAVLFRK